jgi:hypothetical protein
VDAHRGFELEALRQAEVGIGGHQEPIVAAYGAVEVDPFLAYPGFERPVIESRRYLEIQLDVPADALHDA